MSVARATTLRDRRLWPSRLCRRNGFRAVRSSPYAPRAGLKNGTRHCAGCPRIPRRGCLAPQLTRCLEASALLFLFLAFFLGRGSFRRSGSFRFSSLSRFGPFGGGSLAL